MGGGEKARVCVGRGGVGAGEGGGSLTLGRGEPPEREVGRAAHSLVDEEVASRGVPVHVLVPAVAADDELQVLVTSGPQRLCGGGGGVATLLGGATGKGP